ncbi:helix-turn-helix domain-containing protein [Ruminococcaceae bacterium OttesenSCG-928-L11]|nr:helix-turn-helix domain-containing protein [Ruminococcaceae bacterium OttesenSCG-928-L11]
MDIAKLRHVFSTRIRKLREGKLNQGEFADSVGISRGAMSYYEQESRTPDIGVLRAICVKYNVSADYLLGIIPDPNHQVADVCQETGLSPDAVKTLNLLTRLINAGEFPTKEHMADTFGDELLDVFRISPFTSVPEVLNILLRDDEGLSLLTMLGAVITGAEVDTGGKEIQIRIKSAAKNFQITVPVEDITPALWVNIQSHADDMRKKFQAGEE